MARRADLLERLRAEATDCIRLFHGATEGLPGVAVDRYGPEVLVQVWRPEALADVDAGAVKALVEEVAGRDLRVRIHPRGRGTREPGRRSDAAERSQGLEGGLEYDVTAPEPGRDPLLFLDFRAGRRRVREAAEGRSVLNLFSYTCGIGVAAAAGGARSVLNIDFAASALAVGQSNADRNGVSSVFETLREDVLPSIRQLGGLGVKGRGAKRSFTRLEPQTFDLVVLDPPRWSKSAFGAVDLVRDYPSLFKPSLLATTPGGSMLVTNNVAAVGRDQWLDTLRRSATKAGRPLRSVEVVAPETDFPSPDGNPPLKMAWLEV